MEIDDHNKQAFEALEYDEAIGEWRFRNGSVISQMDYPEMLYLYLYFEIDYLDFQQMMDEYQEENFDYEPGYLRKRFPWTKFLTAGLNPKNSCARIDDAMKWVEHMDLEILVPFKPLFDDFVKNRKSLHQKSRQIAFKMSRRMERAGLAPEN